MNFFLKKIETIKEKEEIQENYKMKQMQLEKESLTKTLTNLKKLMKIEDVDL